MNPRAAIATFQAISPLRAVDEIAAQVRAMLADGRLKPGDRLPSERELALRLGVGRNTLREAIRTLESAGLIAMHKGGSGGAHVRNGSPGAIVTGMSDLYHLGAITPKQLTEARLWFSDVVIRVACERAEDEHFALLEENIAATTRAHAVGRFDERQRLNREFHVLLARATRNPVLEIATAGMMEVFRHFIERIGPSENPFILPSRRRFMKHLRKRDARAAAAEMNRLLARLHTNYLELWSERGGKSA